MNRNGMAKTLVDGGMDCYNPVSLVLEECHALFHDIKINALISIGTDAAIPQEDFHNDLIFLAPRVDEMATDARNEAKRFYRHIKANDKELHRVYFRFNAHHVLAEIPLQEWRSLAVIRQQVQRFLLKQSWQDRLVTCGKLLMTQEIKDLERKKS